MQEYQRTRLVLRLEKNRRDTQLSLFALSDLSRQDERDFHVLVNTILARLFVTRSTESS